jgi:glycosyltransferase involved in cell wall biosynthesis
VRTNVENDKVERLLIISSAIHYVHDGRVFGYAPYAREIDVWADLFREVIVAAPCRTSAPPPDCVEFTRPNISVRPLPETGGETAAAKLTQIFMRPALSFDLCRAMRRADAIQVRCPGNLGLLGVMIAPLFSRRLVARYTGQWTGYSGEPFAWRMQRAMLKSEWWRGPVTVYGEWPKQPPHIEPFFNAALDDRQLQRARGSAGRRATGFAESKVARVLYVGRLSESKNAGAVVDAIAQLKNRGLQVECDLVGEGPERAWLERLVETLGIGDRVHFAGGVDFDRVLDFYEKADVLALISETEGWPKAIAEAMAFGLICIGSDRGLIPTMLGDGRGIVVPPGDAQALASAIERFVEAPDDFAEMSRRAAEWGRQYSLEGMKQAIGRLLCKHWRMPDQWQMENLKFRMENETNGTE